MSSSTTIDFNKLSPVKKSQHLNQSSPASTSSDFNSRPNSKSSALPSSLPSPPTTHNQSRSPPTDQNHNIDHQPPPSKVTPSDFVNRNKVPKMISHQLPLNLLSMFSIPQLKVEDLAISRYEPGPVTPTGDHHLYHAHQQPGSPSTHTKSQLDSPLPPPPPSSLNKQESYLNKAKSLKHIGEQNYNSKEYQVSILNFIESLLLFIIEFYSKELRNPNSSVKNASENSTITIKEKNWFNLIKFNNKIIENFTSLSTSKKNLNVNYLNGLCHFINAGLLNHIYAQTTTSLKQTIKSITSLNDDQEISHDQTDKLLQLNIKLLRLNKSIKSFVKKGEMNLGIRKIFEKFPRVFWGSKEYNERLDSNNEDDLDSFNFQKLGDGDYCLPVVNMLDVGANGTAGANGGLANLINFGYALLKEWAIVHNINDYQWTI